MPDKKLTDNEIKKEFETLIRCANFVGSDYVTSPLELKYLLSALDLINHLQAEVERLTSGKCVYLSDDETTEYCVEGPCPKYKTETQIKAEAYKEFAERFNKEAEKVEIDREGDFVEIDNKIYDTVPKWCKATSENLLKELVGEQPILNDVKCIDCEHLELELPYAVCSKAYKGIVQPNDSCGKGKLKELVGDIDEINSKG